MAQPTDRAPRGASLVRRANRGTSFALKAIVVTAVQATAFVLAARASGPAYLWWAAATVAGVTAAGALTRLRWKAAAVLLLVGTFLSLAGWARPHGTFVAPAAPPGSTWLVSGDGSRLWYEVHPRRKDRGVDSDPLVAVHGGPGVPWSADEQAEIADLSDTRDVWVYDQIGTGYSSRLPDPKGYTFERALADLELVVEEAADTAKGKVVLLGHSFGAAVSAAYAAEHPDRVSGMVLMSPGSPPVHEAAGISSDAPQGKLSWSERVRLYGVALRPRNLFIYALTAASPAAASSLITDAEADARYADIYRGAAAGLVCPDTGAPPPPVHPLGHFANQMPQLRPDSLVLGRPDFALLGELPVLILRGECDYIRGDVVDDYLEILPAARAVELPGLGHSLLEAEGTAAMEEIRTYLDAL